MRLAVVLLAITSLLGCTTAQKDEFARNAAKSAASKVLVERYPGLPVEPAVNCVIDNANSTQILALATDSVTGPTESTVQIVSGILQKPETVQCLGVAAGQLLLNGGL